MNVSINPNWSYSPLLNRTYQMTQEEVIQYCTTINQSYLIKYLNINPFVVSIMLIISMMLFLLYIYFNDAFYIKISILLLGANIGLLILHLVLTVW